MKKIVASIALAALLSGCSLIPQYHRPDVAMPAQWKGGRIPLAPASINADWWRNFNDPELDALMEQALTNNNDLGAALARIQEAQADLKIAGAPLLPTVDATGTAGGIFNRSHGATTWIPNSNGGLQVNYEVDLFGGNRAGIAAARANLTGSVFDHDALALVIMSEVAKGYFSLISLHERVDIAQSNLANQRSVMKIVQARFNAGSSSALDLSRQKSEVATNEASLAALQNQASAAENALAVLLGEPPRIFRLKIKALRQLRVPKVPLTQPSTIVEQRPDIRKAEQDLIAANADIGVARAALFPRLNLGAAFTAGVAEFFGPSDALNLAASLVAPIFHGGALQGGVQKATAREMELAQDYRKVILTSLQEVEDALSAAKAARLRNASLGVAMAEARKTYSLSRDLYQAGSVDYQTLLDSQRTLLTAEDTHAQAELELLDAAVDLYKALGGGWHDGGKPFPQVAARVEKVTTTKTTVTSTPHGTTVTTQKTVVKKK